MSERDVDLDRLISAVKRHDHPSAATTDRAWASLDAALGAGAAPSVPIDLAAAAGAAGGLGSKALVLVGIAAITAITTATVAWTIESRGRAPTIAVARDAPHADRDAPDAEVAPTQAAADPIAPAVLAPASAIVPATTDSPEPPTAEAAAPTPRRTPAASPTHDAAPTSTLAEEARLLGEAWRALNAGDPARALATVKLHAERFPTSALANEREAARIVAWCQEDRTWAAEQARRFIADHTGAVVTRVERACSDALGPKKP